jgi:O-antigen/teichoic acid export membrane protein
LVSFGLRALPGVSSPLETFRLDQAVVGLLLSPFDLGLYVVAIGFTVLPRLMAFSIGAAAYPRLAAIGDTAGARILARRAVWLTVGLCAGVVVPLVVSASFLVNLVFGEQFSGAIVVTQILLVGAFLAGVRRIVGDVSRGLGRPGVGSLGEVASWASAVPLVALLLPAYGLEGVAIALAAASGVSLVVVLGAARWSVSRLGSSVRSR